jgi:hypothetical protein
MNQVLADPTDAFFRSLNPYDQFGVVAQTPTALVSGAVSDIPGIARSTGPGSSMPSVPPWHPQNALFPFGVLLAVTFGLVAFSTHFGVRVGKQRATAKVDIGKGSQ